MRLDGVFTRFVLALMITLTTLVGASTAPAHADGGTYRDPARDAPARFDLTRVHYEYRESAVSMKAHIRNLHGGITQLVGLSIRPVRSNVSFGVYIVRHADGTLANRLMRADPDGITRVRCRIRSRWHLGKDYVYMTFNQRCLHSFRAARLSAWTAPGDGRRGDYSDLTDRSVRLRYTD